MFELGRELKRIFGSDRARLPADGVTGGDPALLELLDLELLLAEGKAADVAAGRISVEDKPQRRLEAAIVWREAARRAGDPVALRKAAAAAEAAAAAFQAARRPDGWARARCEQALCALIGEELFGDEGLAAAAEIAFREARAAVRGGLAAPLADIGLAVIDARRRLISADAAAAHVCAGAFTAPIAALDALSRRVALARILAAEARLTRADLLCGWAARLRDDSLALAAVEDAAAAARRLNPAYEPLTWARAEMARGQALALWGELSGDIDGLAAGATALSSALETLTRDHSPIDWAKAQVALGHCLQGLGETCADPHAFEQAASCFDRANLVLRGSAVVGLRGQAAGARAMCLARSAELSGDLAVLDAAEAAMKIELAGLNARRDPAGWALAQLHLARIYEARMAITGRDGGARGAALMALDAALDVFADQGMHGMSVLASEALRRLRAGAPGERREV